MGGPGGTQQPHADGKNSRLLQASQTLEKERMGDAFDTMFLLLVEPCSLLVLMRSDRTRRCVLDQFLSERSQRVWRPKMDTWTIRYANSNTWMLDDTTVVGLAL